MNSGLLISAWRVGIVLAVGVGCVILLHSALRNFERHLSQAANQGERLKRMTTLVHAGRSIGYVLILLIVVLMILHELGINITPIIASAGVVGLAFSLGVQMVIKDFLGGIVILTENQFKIGDVVTVGQITGSYQDSAHTGMMAVDGYPSTLWQTKQAKGKNTLTSEWIEVDLSASQSISQVNLSWDAYYATSYSIQVSNDHTNWSPVFNTSKGDGATDTLTFSTVQARYIRMTSSAWNTSTNRNWLKEFEVYANATSSSPPPTSTPSPTPSPTQTGNSVHVGDLDASSAMSGSRWNATVIVTVHDASNAPVPNVTVNGSWGNGTTGTGSCTTGADGTCSISRTSLKTTVSSVSFSVTGLSAGDPYQSSANQDPDGDSNGTTIIVSKP